MKNQQLAGKAAVVTGSTSGIGRAIAEAFAREGAHVMLNGFGDRAAIEALRADLEKLGVKARYHGADMTKGGEIDDLIATAEREFGKVDILVNNAGVQHVSPIESFPPEKWDWVIAINLTSVFRATRAALPGMLARKSGRIVNIASAHGLVASPNKSAYVAAKHGVVGLTKVTALENAEKGGRCNAICPGLVLTPLVEKQIDDQARTHAIPRAEVIDKVMLERQPSKAFVKIEEVAALAVFLCSDGAASITGTPVAIDGGWVAQ